MSRILAEDEDITEANVDSVIREALNTYSNNGRFLDALFWRHCLGLLQKKYNFKLEKPETLPPTVGT